MRIMKSLLLAITAITQLVGTIFIFISLEIALTLFIIYGVAFASLIATLVVERIKEKKEEEDNDYRDY